MTRARSTSSAMIARTLLAEVLEGEPLTPRELEVLELVVDGLSSPAIAGKLYLAPETVRTYRKRIVAKLGARNTAHAVAIAFRRRLVT